MKLYSGPLSLFTAKVRVALEEKALDYQRVDVGWSLENRYLPHHPDVARLNPRAQVPVLVDGEITVCDSTLILEYLEDAHPGTPLLPKDPGGRALARHWEAWADEVLFPQIWELIEGGFYPATSDDETARFEAARVETALLHAVLDSHLAGREWIAGDFGIADIGCFIIASAGLNLGAPPAPEHTNLLAWFSRAAERPSIQHEMTTMLAFVASIRPS